MGTKMILGTGNIGNPDCDLGNRVTKQFVSVEQENRYSPWEVLSMKNNLLCHMFSVI